MDPNYVSIVRHHIWKAFNTVTRLEAFLHGASAHEPDARLFHELGIAHLTNLRDEVQLRIQEWKEHPSSANATEPPADEHSERTIHATDVDGHRDAAGELAGAFAAKASVESENTLSTLISTVTMTDMIIDGPIRK